MKRYLVILFLFVCIALNAQRIIYKPVFIDQCTDSIATETYWWITDCDSTIYNLDNFLSQGVYLPRLGKYCVYLNFGEEAEIIEFNSTGIRIDTFYNERVKLVSYVSNPPHSEYFDCDKLANGRIIDFYYNGHTKLIGTFRDGQPIDTVQRFYRSGGLKEMYIPSSRKKQQVFFYKNGNIKSDNNYSKGYSKDYYETGELKKVDYWKRKHTQRTEYLNSGQISLKENKNRQTIYYPNGTIRNQTTRKEVLIFERIFTKYGRPWYEYQSFLYDSLGNKVAFYQFGGNGFKYGATFPKDISEIKAYQFEKLVIYDKGIEVNNFDFYKIDNEDEELRIRRLLIDLFNELNN